jgi:hypothetical protein
LRRAASPGGGQPGAKQQGGEPEDAADGAGRAVVQVLVAHGDRRELRDDEQDAAGERDGEACAGGAGGTGDAAGAQAGEADQAEGEGDDLDQGDRDERGTGPGVAEHVIAHQRRRLDDLADDAGGGVDDRCGDQRDRGLLRWAQLELLESRQGTPATLCAAARRDISAWPLIVATR